MPAVTGGAQFVATYVGPGGATAANIHALANIGGDFDQAAVDNIADAWADFWSAFASDEWSLNAGMEFRDLRVDPYDVLIAGNGAVAGTDSSDPELPAIAAVVSISAATGGRRGKGRMYLPGVPASSTSTGGTLDAGFITATLADYVTFSVAVAGEGWVPAVYSRSDGVVRGVATVGMSPIVDTQRRRQGRLEP